MKVQGHLRLVVTVTCPTCGAEPGWTCRTRGFGGDRAPHKARYVVAGADEITGEAPVATSGAAGGEPTGPTGNAALAGMSPDSIDRIRAKMADILREGAEATAAGKAWGPTTKADKS